MVSKKFKIQYYDAVASQRDKLDLALHDLINKRFTDSVTLRERDYGTGNGKLVMRASWRGMPLYLVEWCFPDQDDTIVSVYTDTELSDMTSGGSLSDSRRILRDAYYALVAGRRAETVPSV